MLDIIFDLFRGFQSGRLIESLIFLAVLWLKVKPHLKKLEDQIAGIATIVNKGFDSGEQRFLNIETRLDKIEHPVEPESQLNPKPL